MIIARAQFPVMVVSDQPLGPQNKTAQAKEEQTGSVVHAMKLFGCNVVCVTELLPV